MFFDDYKEKTGLPILRFSFENAALHLERYVSVPSAFLMVSPEQFYFKSGYEVFLQALDNAGADVLLFDGEKLKGKRNTWIRDKFIIVDRTAYFPDIDKFTENLIANVGLPKKQVEIDALSYFLEFQNAKFFLESAGYKSVEVKGSWFEGGNIIALEEKGTLLFGFEPDYDLSSADILQQAIAEHGPNLWSVLPLRIDPSHFRVCNDFSQFYHLDTILNVLPDQRLMIYPQALVQDDYYKLEQLVGAENFVKLSKLEAIFKFATNFISIGEYLVMTGNIRPKTREFLQNIQGSSLYKSDYPSYKIIEPENYGLNSFALGLGGVRCMTNPLFGYHFKIEPPRNTL